MRTVLVDYEAGNLHSAEKAFQRMAAETGAGEILVTGDPDAVAGAGRIVLPGDGAFAACRAALEARPGLMAALHAAVIGRRVPFMGICMPTWARKGSRPRALAGSAALCGASGPMIRPSRSRTWAGTI